MKSIKELSWNVSEEEYRADSAYSYSIIAKFAREGFRKIGSLFESTPLTPSLSFGSLLDSIISNNGVPDNRFTLQEDIKYSGKMTAIVKTLVREYGNSCSTIKDIGYENIDKVAKEMDYYAHNRYNAIRVSKIRAEGEKLYERLRITGSIGVTQKDLDDAIACYRELKDNPYTSRYLMDYANDTEAYHQIKFKSQYQGIDVKCMFDRLIVSHVDKVIIPVDYKITQDEDKFNESVFKWRYDIQARLYIYILKEVISKDEYFKDFTIAPFQFVVINRFNKTPLVWEFLVPEDNKAPLFGLDRTCYDSWVILLQNMIDYIGLYQVKKGGYSKKALLNNGFMVVPFTIE